MEREEKSTLKDNFIKEEVQVALKNVKNCKAADGILYLYITG